MKKHRGKLRFYTFKMFWVKAILLMMVTLCVLSISFDGTGALAQVFFNKTGKKLPVYCVQNSSKQIAISFDAAWGSDKTESILNILKEENVLANFFLVGMWVDKNEELTKKIYDAGMEIGTHSNTHANFTSLSKTQMELELTESVKKIENITKETVKLFRTPFGAYDNNVISVAENLGLQTIQWDVDSLDWKGISSEEIVKNILKKVSSGSIILCHNNAESIVEALPSVLKILKSQGYEFVHISDLLLKENFTIDITGRQILK
ncbi:MAG: hypothetical protein EOM55_01240 [Clostridia bacterium]|nr:hypothetical protein [Clostridia bacterium]